MEAGVEQAVVVAGVEAELGGHALGRDEVVDRDDGGEAVREEGRGDADLGVGRAGVTEAGEQGLVEEGAAALGGGVGVADEAGGSSTWMSLGSATKLSLAFSVLSMKEVVCS